MLSQLQRAVSLVYPNQCVLCEVPVVEHGGLCGECWRETPFLNGLVCHTCGVSLPGDDKDQVCCDECLTLQRPWKMGRAALSYRDAGRRVVLALKHADRLDLVPSCAEWMTRAGAPLFTPETLIVPVPTHWSRLLTRRYNQAAELARGVSKCAGLPVVADGLVRVKRTRKQDGMTLDERFANVHDAILPHPKFGQKVAGRDVCLVDDVMTSGATLTVATEALYEAGARQVCVLVLARVEKAP